VGLARAVSAAISDAHEHGMDRRRNLDEFSRAFNSSILVER
jgi:hypothetical protein